MCNKKEYQKNWRESNKGYGTKYMKEWRELNKEYIKEYEKRYREKNKEYIQNRQKNYNRTIKARYKSIESNALKRNIKVSITIQQYKRIVSSNTCYYCSNSLPETGSGLDRINSSKGYTIDNVRPCCSLCNQAKNDLTEKDFFSLIEAIYKKHLQKFDKINGGTL